MMSVGVLFGAAVGVLAFIVWVAVRLLCWTNARRHRDPPRSMVWVTVATAPDEPGGSPGEMRFLISEEAARRAGKIPF